MSATEDGVACGGPRFCHQFLCIFSCRMVCVTANHRIAYYLLMRIVAARGMFQQKRVRLLLERKEPVDGLQWGNCRHIQGQ